MPIGIVDIIVILLVTGGPLKALTVQLMIPGMTDLGMIAPAVH